MSQGEGLSRRALNWPQVRLERLLEAAFRERHIIRNNGGGTTVGKEEKRQAWQRILEAVNATYTDQKTLDQVKAKLSNFCTDAKKRFQAILSEVRRTGGGISNEEIIQSLTRADQLALSYLGYENAAGVPGTAMREIPMPNTTNNERPQRRGVHDIMNTYNNSMENNAQPTRQLTVQVGQSRRFPVPSVNRQAIHDNRKPIYQNDGNESSSHEFRRMGGQQNAIQQPQVLRSRQSGRNNYHADIPLTQLTPPIQSGSITEFGVHFDSTQYGENPRTTVQEVTHPFTQEGVHVEIVDDQIEHLTPPNSSSSSIEPRSSRVYGKWYSHYERMNTNNQSVQSSRMLNHTSVVEEENPSESLRGLTQSVSHVHDRNSSPIERNGQTNTSFRRYSAPANVGSRTPRNESGCNTSASQSNRRPSPTCTESVPPNRRNSAPSTTPYLDATPGTSDQFVNSHLIRHSETRKRRHDSVDMDNSNSEMYERNLAFLKYKKEVESRENIVDILKNMQAKVDHLTQVEKQRKQDKEEMKRILQQERKEIEEDRVLQQSIMDREREDFNADQRIYDSQERLIQVMLDLSANIQTHTESFTIHNRILEAQRKGTQQMGALIERQNVAIGIHTTTLNQCVVMLNERKSDDPKVSPVTSTPRKNQNERACEGMQQGESNLRHERNMEERHEVMIDETQDLHVNVHIPGPLYPSDEDFDETNTRNKSYKKDNKGKSKNRK